jgi:hypothetical protein
MLYRDRLILSVAAALLALLPAAFLAHQAKAHDAPSGWRYPWECCSKLDCREVESKAISERPDGYVINSTGEVVAYADKRVLNSPDGEYHWCAHRAGLDAGHTICLFVPSRSY